MSDDIKRMADFVGLPEKQVRDEIAGQVAQDDQEMEKAYAWFRGIIEGQNGVLLPQFLGYLQHGIIETREEMKDGTVASSLAYMLHTLAWVGFVSLRGRLRDETLGAEGEPPEGEAPASGVPPRAPPTLRERKGCDLSEE